MSILSVQLWLGLFILYIACEIIHVTRGQESQDMVVDANAAWNAQKKYLVCNERWTRGYQ